MTIRNDLLIVVLLIFQITLSAQNADSTNMAARDGKLANKLYNESLALFGENNYTEAISAINKAIALNEDFSNAYYNRACFNLKLNNIDEAINDFNKVIEIEANARTFTGRGYAYLLSGIFRFYN